MNPPDENILVKWFDDQLSSEELQHFESVLAENPDLIQEKADFILLKQKLQTILPASEEPPLADLMRHQIQQSIQPECLSKPNSNFWKLLIQPKALVPLASAACLSIGWFAGSAQHKPTQTFANSAPTLQPLPLHSEMVYTPDATISARVMNRSEATVIVVDGLDAVPDQLDLVQRQPQQAMWSSSQIDPSRS